MGLDNKLVRSIEEFVYSKPRSVQEIAQHINKSWRTADRYVDDIAKEFGTISSRTFREGTRGALKIVFWSSVEKASSSVFQQQLEQDILLGRKKEDFSAFDIFQHVDKKSKAVCVVKCEEDNLKEFLDFIANTKKQLLVFSGNLSFMNLTGVPEVFEDLIKRGVSIKVVSRVDLAGRANVERILSFNFKHGKDLVEIRHKEQPIRAVISDNRAFRIKEIKEPTGKSGELSKRMLIFYTVRDVSWSDWLSRIFWKLFSSSIDANKRLDEMKRMS